MACILLKNKVSYHACSSYLALQWLWMSEIRNATECKNKPALTSLVQTSPYGTTHIDRALAIYVVFSSGRCLRWLRHTTRDPGCSRANSTGSKEQVFIEDAENPRRPQDVQSCWLHHRISTQIQNSAARIRNIEFFRSVWSSKHENIIMILVHSSTMLFKTVYRNSLFHSHSLWHIVCTK